MSEDDIDIHAGRFVAPQVPSAVWTEARELVNDLVRSLEDGDDHWAMPDIEGIANTLHMIRDEPNTDWTE